MNIFQFLFSKVFFKNLLAAIVLVVVLLVGTWFALAVMTDHGKFVSVPPLDGIHIDEVEAILNEHELHHLVIDSIWSESGAPGTVVEQNPIGGARVKRNRKILLTIYRETPQLVKLGIEEGVVANVAMIKLRNKGVHFDTKFESNALLDGMIIRIERKGKTIEADSEIVPGEKLTLVIGKQGDAKVSVPSLRGMSLEEAEKRLLTSNLSLSGTFYVGEFPTALDSNQARIFKQSPGPSSEALTRIGAGVDVWLTKDVPADTLRLNQDSL
jgi:eukaryotic-like serine/threonine-protein kinase